MMKTFRLIPELQSCGEVMVVEGVMKAITDLRDLSVTNEFSES